MTVGNVMLLNEFDCPTWKERFQFYKSTGTEKLVFRQKTLELTVIHDKILL
jgi:hypothetical protein